MSASVLVRRMAGWVVLLLVFAGCGEANVDASTTSPGEASSTTSTVITSTTAADATTTTSTVITSTTAADTTTTTESTMTTEAVTGQIVEVVFASADQSDCSNTETFERTIDEAADPIESAFLLLVAGPTSEEQTTGAGSFFSSDTEGMVRSITIAGGLLTVDFEDLRPVIPNASTSCGSFSLIAQLNGTAFQFEEVDRVSYQIEGSCQTFFNWLQRECQEYTRR